MVIFRERMEEELRPPAFVQAARGLVLKAGDLPKLKSPDGKKVGREWTRIMYDTFDQRVDGLITTLPEGSGKLLEIGCASGFRAEMFARAGMEVTAMDVADRQRDISACNRELYWSGNKLIRFYQRDAGDDFSTLPGAPFHMVHASRVIHYLPGQSLPGFMDCARRALLPGGYLAVRFVSTLRSSKDAPDFFTAENMPSRPWRRGRAIDHHVSTVYRAMTGAGFEVRHLLRSDFFDGEGTIGLIAALPRSQQGASALTL